MSKMKDITRKLLEIVSDYTGEFKGAFNIREDGKSVDRQSSKSIIIESKMNKPGINVKVLSGTKGETVYIPACVTKGGIDDMVYNDFFIEQDCDIKIVAGCGVHTDDSSSVQHNGCRYFMISKNSQVHYEEKHMENSKGHGEKIINPVTEAELDEGAYLEINFTQIRGLDNAYRKPNATVAKNARLVIHERLFTQKEQETKTKFKVELNGKGYSVDIVSRSVERDKSYQCMESVIVGNAACKGHSECDSIIDGDAVVDASPRLFARNKEAELIHEAAIGKIVGEQIMKLRTLGLTEEEAEREIIKGFLS